MSVLIWAERFFPEVGGLEKSTYRLCQGLISSGISVIIVAKNARITSTRMMDVISLGEDDFLEQSYQAIRNLQHRVSIIFLPRLIQGLETRHIQLLSLLEGWRHIYLRVPTTENIRVLRDCDRGGIISDRIKMLIAQNNKSKAFCSKYYPNVPCVLSRNSTHLPGEYSKNFRSYFLYAARITPSKNLMTLLRGYELYEKEYGDQAVPLHVYGPVYSREYFRECMEKIRELSNVRYCGIFNPGSVKEIDGAFFTVMPSYREGHSNLLLESLATGTPVAASSIYGLKEDLSPKYSFLINTPNASEELLSVLKKCHALSASDYYRMCDCARQYASLHLVGTDKQTKVIVDAVEEHIIEKDLGIYVVKPEAFSVRDLVVSSVIGRGFEVIESREYSDWSLFVSEFYSDLSCSQQEAYLFQAKKMRWGDNYFAMLVKSAKGDTLSELTKHKGLYDDYQRIQDGSLRAEFGRDKAFNITSDGKEFVYNAIHGTRTLKELIHTISFLKMNDAVERVSVKSQVNFN